MHYAYTVKMPKEDAKTSEEARQQATNVLDSNGFANEGGYFSGSKADWYVIGGRWSGTFSHVLKAKEKTATDIEAQTLIDAELGKPKKNASPMSRNTPDCLAINEHIGSKKLRKQLEKLYADRLGMPFTRSTYAGNGYEDDAMLITPELRKALKKEYKTTEVFDADQYTEMTIKDLDEKDDGAWLVMVDYHN